MPILTLCSISFDPILLSNCFCLPWWIINVAGKYLLEIVQKFAAHFWSGIKYCIMCHLQILLWLHDGLPLHEWFFYKTHICAFLHRCLNSFQYSNNTLYFYWVVVVAIIMLVCHKTKAHLYKIHISDTFIYKRTFFK